MTVLTWRILLSARWQTQKDFGSFLWVAVQERSKFCFLCALIGTIWASLNRFERCGCWQSACTAGVGTKCYTPFDRLILYSLPVVLLGQVPAGVGLGHIGVRCEDRRNNSVGWLEKDLRFMRTAEMAFNTSVLNEQPEGAGRPTGEAYVRRARSRVQERKVSHVQTSSKARQIKRNVQGHGKIFLLDLGEFSIDLNSYGFCWMRNADHFKGQMI